MHLVATNLIIWIEAICKESVEEIFEHEKDQLGENEFGLEGDLVTILFNFILHFLINLEHYD